MRAPFRMAWSDVHVRLLRTGDDQPVDDVFGGPLATVDSQYLPSMTLKGQPRFRMEDKTFATVSGDAGNSDGYVVFALSHLLQAGFTRGDQLKHARIVALQRAGSMQSCDYQITEVVHRGHLRGGPILVKCWFKEFNDLRGAM